MIRTHGVTHYTPDDCYGCKMLTLQLSLPAFKPHWNYAVGRYVTNEAEFRDLLKRTGDANSMATGITHNYEYIPPSDLRTMVPPETAPDPTPSLAQGVAKRTGHPVHPTFIPETEVQRERIHREEKANAVHDSQTKDLIHADR